MVMHSSLFPLLVALANVLAAIDLQESSIQAVVGLFTIHDYLNRLVPASMNALNELMRPTVGSSVNAYPLRTTTVVRRIFIG
jgi:hypothetical protein